MKKVHFLALIVQSFLVQLEGGWVEINEKWRLIGFQHARYLSTGTAHDDDLISFGKLNFVPEFTNHEAYVYLASNVTPLEFPFIVNYSSIHIISHEDIRVKIMLKDSTGYFSIEKNLVLGHESDDWMLLEIANGDLIFKHKSGKKIIYPISIHGNSLSAGFSGYIKGVSTYLKVRSEDHPGATGGEPVHFSIDKSELSAPRPTPTTINLSPPANSGAASSPTASPEPTTPSAAPPASAPAAISLSATPTPTRATSTPSPTASTTPPTAPFTAIKPTVQ